MKTFKIENTVEIQKPNSIIRDLIKYKIKNNKTNVDKS